MPVRKTKEMIGTWNYKGKKTIHKKVLKKTMKNV